MEKPLEFSPEMRKWLENNSNFDAAAFYALTDDDINAEPIADEEMTLPTWKLETKDGVTTMVPGRPLKVSI